jgi:hypothetical protein
MGPKVKGKEQKFRSLTRTFPISEATITYLDKDGIRDIKINDLSDLTSIEASNGFRRIFGIEPGATFTHDLGDENFSKKIFENARDWFELSTPSTQCGNIIGNSSDNDICYICGETLGSDDKDNSPECEHILPVFQAVCYLQLYTSLEGTEPTEQIYKNLMTTNPDLAKRLSGTWNMMKKEYAWSHRCCNQIKSDDSFLTYDIKKEEFVFDKNNAKNILIGIFNGKKKSKDKDGKTTEGKSREYCETLKNNIKSKKLNIWLSERLSSIETNQIEPIYKLLNEKKTHAKGLFYLSTIASIISAADVVYRKETDKLYQVPYTSESLRKADIYTHISKEITTLITTKKWDYNSAIASNRKVKEIAYIMSNFFSPQMPNFNFASYIDSTTATKKIDYKSMVNIITSNLISGNISYHNSQDDDYYFRGFYRDIYALHYFDYTNDEDFTREEIDDIENIHEKSTKAHELFIYFTIYENIMHKNIEIITSGSNKVRIDDLNVEIIQKIKDAITSIVAETDKYLSIALCQSHTNNRIVMEDFFKKNEIVFNKDLFEAADEKIQNNYVKAITKYYGKLTGKDAAILRDDIADRTSMSVGTLTNLCESIKEGMGENPESKAEIDTIIDEYYKQFTDVINTGNPFIDIKLINSELDAADALIQLRNSINTESNESKEIYEAANVLTSFQEIETHISSLKTQFNETKGGRQKRKRNITRKIRNKSLKKSKSRRVRNVSK